MSANSQPPRARIWRYFLAALIAPLGLAFTWGGANLLLLGGSAYYVPAGIALLVAAILLARARHAGALWFGAVLVGTVIWTAWESGADYWRWVPRLGLLLVLGIAVALLLPSLTPTTSRSKSRWIAGGLASVLLVAIALAFVPHGRSMNAVSPRTIDPAAPTKSTAAVGDAEQPADAPAAGDWGAYGRNNAATRYSPLNAIDRRNVNRLKRAWVYRTGDVAAQKWGAETTPLKIGNTLYLCSSRNILIALDARTGDLKWRHDPKVSDDAIPYTAACRGVAFYATPTVAGAAPASIGRVARRACATRIIEATLDGRLIAVDAGTGVPCADFGDHGEVDITQGMGEVIPGMVSITSAPTIVRGVVVTGHQVLDGQYRRAPSGVIQGFDAVTGELRWAWDLARPERRSRPPEGEVYTPGTPNMWTTASADAELGLVYLPMGNSAADYWSSSRSDAENRYSTALVALDVLTGQPRWHFQTVHVDVWDYDLGSQATLVDFPTAAGRVPALVLSSKQGDVYVLDRRTGAPLTALEERPVPQGGLEPARRSPTQPFSRYHTLRKADLTERDMWGLTPVDQLFCRIAFRDAVYEGIYTPPTSKNHWIQYPGYNGGSDWGGIAIDTQRRIIVANYNDLPNYNRLVPRAEAERLGWGPHGTPEGKDDDKGDPQIGTPYAIEVNAGWRVPFTQLLCKQPPYGGIRAIDLDSGLTLWDRPLGTARKNGPFKIPSMLPIEIGTPNNGGAAVTAGGLIFIAAATDDLIRAIDIDTGETLWHDRLPAGGQATPMVYEVGGREFLVIMAGGHHFMGTPAGDFVIAYSLPP